MDLTGMEIANASLKQLQDKATGSPETPVEAPKKTDKKALKKEMKAIAKSMGVECDFCHDMNSMDKDTKMKKKARDMMKMMNSANATLKKAKFKKKITCNMCHRGKKEPKE